MSCRLSSSLRVLSESTHNLCVPSEQEMVKWRHSSFARGGRIPEIVWKAREAMMSDRPSPVIARRLPHTRHCVERVAQITECFPWVVAILDALWAAQDIWSEAPYAIQEDWGRLGGDASTYSKVCRILNRFESRSVFSLHLHREAIIDVDTYRDVTNDLRDLTKALRDLLPRMGRPKRGRRTITAPAATCNISVLDFGG